MPNGIYSAAAGMAAQQSRIDALANDLSNAQTDGYKSVRVGFRDLAYSTVEQGIRVGSGAAAVELGRTFAQGPLTSSEDPLALALEGSGFFQVKTPDGRTALTRDGQFQLDATGELVTATGDRLVPPVKFAAGTKPEDVTVANDGTISVKGAKLTKLQLVDVPAPDGLLPIGDNLFVPSQASGGAAPARGASVRQGQLEGSNVDVASSMIDLLDAQRSYELASRAIKMQDQLLQTANDLRH
jgi:flagellar basal-body rod protein FlgG